MSIIDSGVQDFSWRKASRSAGNGECVEIASALGRISIRDSKDPEGPIISCSVGAFQSFLDAAKKAVSSR